MNVERTLETHTEWLIWAANNGIFPKYILALMPPIRDYARNCGFACIFIFRYKDMCGEKVISAVHVVKCLNVCNVQSGEESKNLTGKSANANITPDDALHVWECRYPFRECNVKIVAALATTISQCHLRS